MTIVRYMDRFGELDVESLKNHLKNTPLDDHDTLFPWPTLDFDYNKQTDGLILFHNRYILSREQFYALVAEVEKIYDNFSDEAIEEYNDKVREKRYSQDVIPPQPKPPREFNEKPKVKPNGGINTRDCGPGYIYLMRDLDNSNVYKIGLARDVERRKNQIGRVEIAHMIPVDNMAQAEADLHERFEMQWLEGEWFKLQELDIKYIKSLIEYKDYKFTSNEAAE